MKQEIKTIGTGGQIYLGKEYAGQHVVITKERKGVWVIKTADVIPHDEAWIHTPENKAKLDKALEWISETPFKGTTSQEAEELFQKALGGKDNP
jgi:CTP synthase (UTP-ammonia lyase)